MPDDVTGLDQSNSQKQSDSILQITDEPATASQWLSQGRLLAYPTESVWGLGCDALCPKAIEHLMEVKRRNPNKGLIVLTANWQILDDLFEVSDEQKQRMISYQDLHQQNQSTNKQAITWLLPLKPCVQLPKLLTGTHRLLAVRVTSHPLVAKLCTLITKNNAKNPYGLLVSTSCNLSQHPPARTLDQAAMQFGNQITYLAGETLGFEQPSTIIDGQTGQVIR